MESMGPADSFERVQQRLTDLRNGLVRLHKALLDSECASYDRDIERITSSGQMLDLALNDPRFAWLRQISQMIVVIDETLDAEEPATAIEAERLIVQARAMLPPPESSPEFRASYLEALQRDPDAVLAHAEMMRVLAAILK
jgi:hypothetical protein